MFNIILKANPCAGAWVKRRNPKPGQSPYLPATSIDSMTVVFTITEPGIYRYNHTRKGSGYLLVRPDGTNQHLTAKQVQELED